MKDDKLFLFAINKIWGIIKKLRSRKKMTKKKYKDPVCRKYLAKETKNIVEKDGKVYYFCSPHCKEKFEKDSEKYLKLVG